MIMPAYFSINNIFLNNKPQKRLMIVFKTLPCSRYLDGKKCYGCAYERHSLGGGNFDLVAQYSAVRYLVKKNNIRHIDVLSSGSVLDERQVSFSNLVSLVKEISKDNIESVLIEGRVDYFDIKKIEILKKHLKNVLLEYGVGLEVWSDHIRNGLIKKDLTIEDYKNLVRLANSENVKICTYVLFGIPGLTLGQTIKETVLTIRNIFLFYEHIEHNGRVALFPFFVPNGSDIEKIFNKNSYKIVELKDVLVLLKTLGKFINFKKNNIFVGLDDEGLSGGKCIKIKTEKDKERLKRINYFNHYQKI